MTSENGGFHPNGSGAPPIVPFPGPPTSAPVLAPAPAPLAPAAPVAVAEPPAEELSPETLIFRSGLITPDQLGELVQERVRSGRPAHEIVIERGWADAAMVAQALVGQVPVQPSPPPVQPVPVEQPPALELVPEPVQEPAPSFTWQPEPALEQPVAAVLPEPEPAAAEPAAAAADAHTEPSAGAELEFSVSLHFAGGERVQLGSFAGAAAAKDAAREAAARLAAADEGWPFLGGRFVRPEAVLSVAVDAVVR